MALKNESIIIHQALHGYDHGHSLLVSSIDVTSEAKRKLLIMSDMSGASMQSGFDEYLTGYPIKEMNVYALAKTWNAPEMKRPGCVWTQTLLIKFSDLANIESYFDLVNLFKRPKVKEGFDYYKSQIEILNRPWYNQPFSSSSVGPKFIKRLISALYDNPTSPIIIQSTDAKTFEDMLLTIWIQQWPRLRKNFGFCTGAISARSTDGKLLDLQVVPESIKNISKEEYILVKSNDSNETNKIENWVEAIYADLISPTSIRSFYEKYGIDVKGDRNDLKSLSKIYCYLNDNNKSRELQKLLKLIVDLFPSPNEANNLKNTLLGATNRIDNRIPEFSEEEILYHLAITKCHKSLNYEGLKFIDRFLHFYELYPEKALKILDEIINSDINYFGEEMVKKISESIDEGNFLLIISKFKNLVYLFTSLNPGLWNNKRPWMESSNHGEVVSLLLKRNVKSEVDWKKIVFTLIELKSDINPEIFLETDSSASHFVLDWVNEFENKELDYRWSSLIRKRPSSVLEWLEATNVIRNVVLDLILINLDPNSLEVRNFGCKIWLQILDRPFYVPSSQIIQKIKSFGLALAFNNPDEKSFKLAAICFESVYESLINNSIDYSSWKYLEIHTKPLAFWKDWDRCKKLINALVEKSQTFNWPILQLSQTFYNNDILGRIYSRLDKF